MRAKFILAGIALMLVCVAGWASVIVESTFDSGETALGAVAGQGGGTGWGTNLWTGPSMHGTVSSGGLDYQVADGGLIDGGDQALLISSNTIARSFNLAPTQTVYYRFLFQFQPAGNQNNEIFLRMNTNSWDTYAAAKYPSSVIETRVGAGNQPQSAFTFNANTTYLMVGRLTYDSGAFVMNEIWINPAYGDQASPDVATTTGSEPYTDVSGVSWRWSNKHTVVDELVFGTRWNDVVPVPEPGTLVLGALGAGLLAARRRARKEVKA